MIKKWKAKMSKDVFKREFTPNNRQERSFHLIKALSSHAVGSIKDKDDRYSVNPSFHDHSAWVLEFKLLKLKIRDLLFTTIYFIYDFELLRKSLFYFIFGVTTKSDPPKILTKGVWGGGGRGGVRFLRRKLTHGQYFMTRRVFFLNSGCSQQQCS